METSREPEDDMLPEYDFRSMPGAVRGKYAERYRERLRLIRLDADVGRAFPDAIAVNAALRQYLKDHPPVTTPA